MPAPSKPIRTKHLPPITLALIIAGTVLVIASVAGLIIPRYLAIQKLDRISLKKNIALGQQEELFPVFAMAKKLSEFHFAPKLPFPERKPLPRESITLLTDTFKSIAKLHGLTLAGNSLDISMLNQDSDHMLIELSLNGELSAFRSYLISLAELEYFDQLQRLRILANVDGQKQMVATLKINVGKK